MLDRAEQALYSPSQTMTLVSTIYCLVTSNLPRWKTKSGRVVQKALSKRSITWQWMMNIVVIQVQIIGWSMEEIYKSDFNVFMYFDWKTTIKRET